MVNPNRFYTYAYLRKDKTPYYIGKGSGTRIYDNEGRPCKKPKDKSRIIFLKQNLIEEEAFKHEKYMIAVFGRKDLGTGILYNRSDGGEGNSGWIASEETRRKMSEVNRGKILSDETKRKIGEAGKGRTHTEETKRKIGEASRNRTYSEEHKRKLSEVHKGRTHTEETKRKIGEASRNRIFSEETRKKLKEINLGKNNPMYGKSHSIETKRKMSETRKGENSPNYGKKWWNDGCGNAKKSVECPGENWVRGMVKRKKRNNMTLEKVAQENLKMYNPYGMIILRTKKTYEKLFARG